jgi:hypothetical protein
LNTNGLKKRRGTAMYFIHHAAVTAETIQKFRQFLAAYEATHPGVIIRHSVGFLGKNYLIFATENIAEVVRQQGIPCGVSPQYRK